jgi:serine/threonine protein phosphatase PrpC
MPEKDYSQATHVGLLRENNEDAILSNPKLGLWLVADGMGGHAAGEVASDIAKTVIEQQVSAGKTLAHAINIAHQSVLQAAQNGEGKYGMGSTVVALKSTGIDVEIAWVGDSRAYLWSENTLQALTTDHSYVQMLYQSGLISSAEMAGHPEKNVITQCLGSTELDSLEVETISRRWHPSDWVLLCSDGLTDGVSDQEICDLLHVNTTPGQAVKALVQAALSKGGKDNISVIIVAQPQSFGAKVSAKWKTLTGKTLL